MRSGCLEEGGPAGVDSTLTYENSDNMVELPIIKYDQKQVRVVVCFRFCCFLSLFYFVVVVVVFFFFGYFCFFAMVEAMPLKRIISKRVAVYL